MSTNIAHCIDNLVTQSIAKVHCQTDELIMTVDKQLSFQQMIKLSLFAQDEATQLAVPVVISIVDGYGLQRFYFAMPNSLLVSHDLATKKAYTAVAMKMPTHHLQRYIKPGGELYGLGNCSNICAIGGAFPYYLNNQLIGAIGISGGSVEQDILIASNTLKRFNHLASSALIFVHQ